MYLRANEWSSWKGGDTTFNVNDRMLHDVAVCSMTMSRFLEFFSCFAGNVRMVADQKANCALRVLLQKSWKLAKERIKTHYLDFTHSKLKAIYRHVTSLVVLPTISAIFLFLFCAYISVPLRFCVVETEKLPITRNQLVTTFVDQQMFNSITFGTIKLSVNTRVLNKHISSCLSQLFLDSFPLTEICGSFPGKIDQTVHLNNSDTSELSNFCTFFPWT